MSAANAAKTGPTQQSESSQPEHGAEELIDKVEEAMSRWVSKAEGDFRGRRRIPRKCSQKDAGLVRAVEEAMMAVWERRSYTTLWELNCLQYSGAQEDGP